MLTHVVAPGKQQAIEAWFREADQKRAKADPGYVPPKRYMTIFGTQHKAVMEFEVPDLDAFAAMMEPKKPIGMGTGSIEDLTVPGMSEAVFLKQMELK